MTKKSLKFNSEKINKESLIEKMIKYNNKKIPIDLSFNDQLSNSTNNNLSANFRINSLVVH